VKLIHSFSCIDLLSVFTDIVVAGMTLDAAFPTPMDEPRKIMSCHFLGTLPVSMATGIMFVLFLPSHLKTFYFQSSVE